MIAVPGIYDGHYAKPIEPVQVPANVRVIITFIDDSATPAVSHTRIEDVAGSLKWTGPAKSLNDMEHAIKRGASQHRL